MRFAIHAVATAALLAWCGIPAAGAQTPSQAQLQRRAEEGERALAAGRYAEAEQAYAELATLSPSTAEAQARLGLIYFQEGKFREAVPALRKAIALKPALPNVETLLAMSLSELGSYEEALPALQQGFRQSADPALRRMAGLHLLRALTGLTRDVEAVDVAATLSRINPDDPEVLYHTGRVFANFAYLQTMRLSRVAPDSIWLHQAAGEANESQGLYDAALREYRDVLARAPRRPGIHLRIGRTLLSRAKEGQDASRAADTSEALREFEQELEVDPSNANAAYEAGDLHRKAWQLEAARDCFARALKSYPDFPEALVGLGRTLIELGQPAAAIEPLRAAIAQNPADKVAHYQLAQAYGRLGQTAEQAQALAAFQRLRDGAREPSSVLAETRRDVTRQELADAKPPR
jgi:tetratricopeptide (TPR) repeat protein